MLHLPRQLREFPEFHFMKQLELRDDQVQVDVVGCIPFLEGQVGFGLDFGDGVDVPDAEQVLCDQDDDVSLLLELLLLLVHTGLGFWVGGEVQALILVRDIRVFEI